MTTVDEPIDWLKPSPLWDFAAGDFRQSDFFRPTLLGFGSDDFMPEFFAAAQAARADALNEAILQPNTGGLLKLFQPVHGRYYLVSGSLCCRIPGFPDRLIDSGSGESAFFLLRRQVAGQEYAWVGPEGQRTWQSTAGQPRRALEQEERLPLARTSTGAGRPLHFGYLPVASGETYRVPAAQLPVDPDESPPDLRIEELGSRFTEPLTGPPDPATGTPDASRSAINQTRNDLARTISVYVLLEGWEYFLEYLPDVAAILRGDAGAVLTAPRQTQKQALLNYLGSLQITPTLSLAQALGEVARRREMLNQPGGLEGDTALAANGFGPNYNLKQHPLSTNSLLGLFDVVRAALPTELPPVALPKLPQRDDAEYVVRLVYERSQCDPPRQYVSLPSRTFRLASFFDPDAPARTIRIPLPGDVSIAGLRKFKKGVSFVMSEAMMRKMESLRGKERDLVDSDSTSLSEPFGLAFICSFSIQIIFIVAFFLLLMFVLILNIVFWWIAFFRICFPIPKSLAPK